MTENMDYRQVPGEVRPLPEFGPRQVPGEVHELPSYPDDVAEEEVEEYDPADHTIEDVKSEVEKDPDLRDDMLAAEKAGKNRVTLVTWLEEYEPAGAGAGDDKEN